MSATLKHELQSLVHIISDIKNKVVQKSVLRGAIRAKESIEASIINKSTDLNIKRIRESVRTEIKRGYGKDISIKSQLKKETPIDAIEFKLSISNHPRNLREFVSASQFRKSLSAKLIKNPARKRRKKGVKVRAFSGGESKIYDGSFAAVKSGKEMIMMRLSKSRLPVKRLSGPSLHYIFRGQLIQREILEKSEHSFKKNFSSTYDYYISKLKARK